MVKVRNGEENDLPLVPNNDGLQFVAPTYIYHMIGLMQCENMCYRIKQFAWVINMDPLVRQVIFQCGRCLQSKELRNKGDAAPIQEPVRQYGIAQRWQLDIWGPFIQEGRKLPILGAIDAFSKYMVAKMMTNKSARSCLEFIINEICLRFGFRKHISTDLGSEYNDKDIAYILAVYNVNRIRTSRYNLRSNGMIEKR